MNTKFSCPDLAYNFDALEPILSSETIELHYGKHLQAYLENLNKLVEGSGYENGTLEDVIFSANGPLFNNGAQVWNHIFYFKTFSVNGGGAPSGSLLRAIEYSFGSFEDFKIEFEKRGATLFGSGWVWLSKNNNDELVITQELNAGNPLREGLTPLLVFDVWEHAYYVDYRNRRAEYLSKLWDIVDWTVVLNRYIAV